MGRVLTALILSLWVMFIGTISYGLGDYEYVYETWVTAFSLPIWSILSVGLWYDTGRLLFGSTIDSKKSNTPIWIRSLFFVVWMSLIFTYIIWVHFSIQAIYMLVVIPLLAIPLKEWLVRDYSNGYFYLATKKEEFFTILTWFLTSYAVYWVLTIGWILIRVWLLDITTDGFVYTID